MEMDSALLPVRLRALRAAGGAALAHGGAVEPVQGSGPRWWWEEQGLARGLGFARLCSLSLLKLSKHKRSGQYWLGKKMGLSWWEAGIAPK